MATKHADLWGFEVADAPVPECLVEIRARSEREWSSFAARPGADVCSAEAKELARRCGIAPSRRRELWMVWSGAQALKDERQAWYASLALKAREPGYRKQHDAQFDQVELDLERTFPEHPFFRDASESGGLPVLRRILTAFVVDSPEVGYTQVRRYSCAAAPAAPLRLRRRARFCAEHELHRGVHDAGRGVAQVAGGRGGAGGGGGRLLADLRALPPRHRRLPLRRREPRPAQPAALLPHLRTDLSRCRARRRSWRGCGRTCTSSTR